MGCCEGRLVRRHTDVTALSWCPPHASHRSAVPRVTDSQPGTPPGRPFALTCAAALWKNSITRPEGPTIPPPGNSPSLVPRLANGPLGPLLLLGVAAVLLFWRSASGSLLPGDDCLYAGAAAESLRDGGFLDLRWAGRPFFDKGPGLLWALMASITAFGRTEFACRLPAMLAGVAVLAGLWRLARAAGVSRGGALAGAALALATNLFYLNARRPVTDVFGLAFALWGFVLVAQGGTRAKAVAGGALLGVALMVKLILPAPFGLALLLLQFRKDARSPGRLALACLGGVLVVAPWHVYMAAVHGGAFYDEYLLQTFASRAAGSLTGEEASTAYLDWAFGRDPVAALVLLASLVPVAIAATRGGRAAFTALALLAGATAPLLMSATGLPQYLVPLLPGVALAAGVAADFLAGPARAVPRPAGVAASFVAFLAAFALANGHDLASPDYAPATRDACETLRSGGAGDRLVGTYDLYDSGPYWYCGKMPTFYAEEPGLLKRVRETPLLSSTVVVMEPAILRDAARSGGYLLLRPESRGDLEASAARAGVRVTFASFGRRLLARLGI